MTAPTQGRIDDGVHRFPLRVYYEDTDAGGIVFYANYLKFAERARTEMLRCMGLDHARLRDEAGITLAVRHAAIDYLAPARLDDALVVATHISAASGAVIEIEQEVRREGALLARIALRVACITSAGRPRPLPPALAAAAAAALSRHDPNGVKDHAR
ncbi:MAG TPA: tol-pal system-associated acyl-CoA thioesterase [Stellaceae bacterium]|nr:tol-pal system-associated acyl-CoA thioesterase [Stellaceae bacterium]